jgi:hypothetical protein
MLPVFRLPDKPIFIILYTRMQPLKLLLTVLTEVTKELVKFPSRNILFRSRFVLTENKASSA